MSGATVSGLESGYLIGQFRPSLGGAQASLKSYPCPRILHRLFDSLQHPRRLQTLDLPTCPSPPTYAPSPNELCYTGLAVPDQILCVLVHFFTIALKTPAHAHTVHFLAQLPGVILPFTEERTRENGSILIVTACHFKGAGMTTPLGYLLLGHLVRARSRDWDGAAHPAPGWSPSSSPSSWGVSSRA